MKIYTTHGVHWSVSGKPTKAFLGLDAAQAECAELVNILRADMQAIIDDAKFPWDEDQREMASGVLPLPEAAADTWEKALRHVQVARGIETGAVDNAPQVAGWMAGMIDDEDLECDVWIEELTVEDAPTVDVVRAAARDLLDAFGGDTPDWLRTEAAALETALKG